MKVLVPVDGSIYSAEALKVASDYVRNKGAQLSVISVAPFIGGIEDHEISPSRRERHMEGIHRHADEAVRQALDMLARERIAAETTETIEASSSVPDAIIDFAEREGVDLIVMGSRGLSSSARFKMGSVATQVVKYSPCSVYLVKIPAR